MKLWYIQEGKKYIVCSDSVCGNFIIGDVVQKYADGSLRNYMVADLVGLAPKGEWEHLDCEVEPIE
jgi:hypothetical protein